ncbi:MAG: V-type ATP synthase subunit I [Clostridiales bacterium]|nr:V-type ATP synthase subunit I [Clostridiales bacterium]
MAVMAMEHIRVCALKRDRKRLLEFLQRQGSVEVSVHAPDGRFSSTDTAAAQALFEKNARTASEALAMLSRRDGGKAPMLGFLRGRDEISAQDSAAFESRWRDRLASAERLLALDREVDQARDERLRVDAAIEALTPWLKLPVPQDFRGTGRAAGWVGWVDGERSADELARAIERAAPDCPAHVEVVHAAREMTAFYVLALRRDAAEVERALASLGFSRPASPTSEPPIGALSRLRQAQSQATARAEAAEAEIAALLPLRDELRLLEDYFLMRAEKYRALSRLGQSRHAIVLKGYVAREDAEALRARLIDRFDCVVETWPAGDDSPVRLKNRPIVAATESVLANYNLPSPGELDPSGVMSFFYYLLFGMMLSDAGYGLIMAVVCGLLPRFYPNMEQSWRRNLRMFFWCGVSTVFWGVLFSSYFGDAIGVLSATFFGRAIEVPPLWFAPLEQPMRLLMFCLALGVLHLVAGYAMKAANLIGRRQYLDLLYDCGFPVLFLAGVLLTLMGSRMFYDMAGFSLALPDWLRQGSLALSGLCALGVVLTGGRESKNWFKRILKGIYAAYNMVAGWLGDILSYSRLLALGLATGVIASVFNSLGAMAGGGALGAVIFAVVFAVGQALNMGINVLGAYVHANRLAYVEFLGKFYEGAGRPFAPFAAHTRHFKIRGEN